MDCITVTLLDGTTWMVHHELFRGRSSLQLWEWMRAVQRAVELAGSLQPACPSNEDRPDEVDRGRHPREQG